MVGRVGVLLLLVLTFVHKLSLGHCQLGPELAARLTPETTPDVQEEAVRQLMQRVIGLRASNLFQVEVNKLLETSSYQVSSLPEKS